MEIVSSHFNEDLQWLENSPYPVHIVAKQGCVPVKKEKFSSVDIIPNFANETGSYLWYILNNYDNLPEKIVFIHGHEHAFHQRIPVFQSIELYKEFDFVDINRHTNYYVWIVPDSEYHLLWDRLLSPFFGQVPKVINFRGHAQFIVSKELILNKSKEFWKFLYEQTFQLCQNNEELSKKIAIFYENIWHIIFGKESPMFNDYFDMFADSNFKSYTLWQFIKEITND